MDLERNGKFYSVATLDFSMARNRGRFTSLKSLLEKGRQEKKDE